MITVSWISAVATHAEVWRLLDLSGMTNSVRQSRNYTKAGYLYLDGRRISGLKNKVKVGSQFTLELRFPNGKIVSETIMLVHRAVHRRARPNTDREINYKG